MGAAASLPFQQDVLALPPVRIPKSALLPVPAYNLGSKKIMEIIKNFENASTQAGLQSTVLAKALAMLDKEIAILTQKRTQLSKLQRDAAGFVESYKSQASTLRRVTGIASDAQANRNLTRFRNSNNSNKRV